MANPNFQIPDVPTRWPRRLLWLIPVLVPLALAAIATLHQGRFLADRALRLTLGDGPVEYRLGMPAWNGALRLKDLTFGDPTGRGPWLTAQSVEIDGHGWWWLFRNAPRQKRLEAELYTLEVRFRQLDVAPGLDPALGDLGPIGLSGAPLETLGCPATARFDAAGLKEAGLAMNNELGFSFEVSTGESRLQTRIDYRLEDGAWFERTLEQQLPMPLSLLVIDQYPLRTESERWRLQDLGFSRVRHKACAERGELIALVDRHVELAQSWARGLGLAAPDGAWASYRRYVRDGGLLILQLDYPRPAPLDEWFERPRPASLLALSEAVLRREDQISRFVPADAFTDGLDGASLKQAQRLPLQDTLWIDPDTALVLLEPEDDAPPGVAPALSASDAPTDSPPDLDALSAPATTVDVPPSAAVAVATPPEAESPAPGQTPEMPRARPPLIPEAKVVVVGEQVSRRVEWAGLEHKIGARVRITTRTGATRVGQLVGWNPGEITLRQRIGGGMAESRIQREMFREATEL